MVNGTMGVGIGMAANIGVNLITGKEVEAEEVIEAGIKTGASMGMATAVAGGIRVAVEKKVIPTVFSRMLTNNTIGAIISSGIGFSGGMTLATTIGLGTIGTVGTILTGGLALAAGAVCGVVGSNIALKIVNGLGKITEKIVDKAVDIVKSGVNKVKNTVSSAWSRVKSFVSKLFN